MKKFFENLFGNKPKPHTAEKRADHAASTLPAPPGFEPYKKGDVIGGKYLVHGTLGMGGFGVVLLASERDTNELFALKTFRDEFLADERTRDAFRHEALLWINLEAHPFILAARWVETFSGRLFVAMDYIAPDAEKRVNLADYLRSRKPIPPARATEWAIQFCMGMEHANAHGIRCHRDIKPANILIAQNGALKLADFGLAGVQHTLTDRERLTAELCEEAGLQLIVERSQERERLVVTKGKDGEFGFSMMQSEEKIMCGTPGYMAPELYRGETADLRSDIYAFGLVLWQMAAGSPLPPFVGTIPGNMRDFMRTTYERQMAGRVPPTTNQLGTVIERCLNPKPLQRYSTFTEVRAALEPIFQKLTGNRITTPIVGEHSVAFWCNRGLSLFSLGRIKEAGTCFDKALAIDPRDAMSWCNKGGVFVEQNEFEEAIACFNKTLGIDPQHALAWSNKGSALKELKKYDDALVCYDNALSVEPRMPTAWNNKGRIFNILGLHEKAIACFDNVLAIDPRHSAAWNNKGRTLGILKHLDEALACFDQAIANEPGDAMAWNNKGAYLAELGRREEEITCYEKAVGIDPRHAMAWFNKASTEDEIGRKTAAIQSYSRFLEVAPPQYAEYVASVRSRLKTLQGR